MALRSLAVKVRIPAAAAPRLLSAPRVLPPSGSRALPFSSSSYSSNKVARDWYLTQRERYDDLTRELKNLRRVVLWTEKLDRFLRRSYLLGAPLAAGGVVVKWINYHKRENDLFIKGLQES